MTKEEFKKLHNIPMEEKLRNADRNINWAALAHTRHKAAGYSFTPSQWKAMSEEEQNAIKKQQDIDKEIYNRNLQVISTPERLYGRKGNKRFPVNEKEYSVTVSENITINYKETSLDEIGYQRVSDLTHSLIYEMNDKNKIRIVEYVDYSIRMSNGMKLNDFLNLSPDERYITTNPEYKNDKSRFNEQ